MSFYTSPAGKFKFNALPDNGSKNKKAYVIGFAKAVAGSDMSATEKVAWLKYANNLPPGAPPPGAGRGGPPPGAGPGGPGGPVGDPEPVAGPGPGFVPEGAPDEQAVQQLLEALPGETPEEKLHSAVMALLEAQDAGADDGGVEDDGTGVEDGELDPALIQQLLGGQQGPPPGAGPGPGPGAGPRPPGPPQGGGQRPPPGAPPKGPQG